MDFGERAVSGEVYTRMAMKMLKEERFIEALGFYRLAKMVASGKIVVPYTSYDFIAPICDFRTWSDRSGFVCRSEVVENAFPERWYFDALPSGMTEFYRASQRQTREIHLCFAQNVHLMQWVFDSGDERYDFFSTSGDLLCDDFYGNRQWLKQLAGLSHLRSVDEKFHFAIVDFFDYSSGFSQIDEPCFFLGSRPNYGHWLLDFLSRLWFVERYPELRGLPMVVGQLKDFHRESLELFGVDNELIEIAPKKQESTSSFSIVGFKNIAIPSRLPASMGKSFYQDKIASLFDAYGNTTRSEKLYLSRKNLAPRHHIENEDEVIAYLEKKGFEILYPEQMTVRETIEKCGKARVVVSSSGAQTANLVFSRQTVFIDLLATNTADWHLLNRRSWSEYIFPLVEHYVPVWCEVASDMTDSQFDYLLTVKIVDLQAALFKAEAILKAVSVG